MALLIPIAFAAGLVTVLTPCILPVLPIVLAGGGSGGRRRPYAIVAGLVTTFTLLTVAAASILRALHLGDATLTKVAVAMLLLLAATLVFPRLGTLLERPFQFLTRRRSGDLGGGFVLGASLGVVFVPCAGPVFGAVSSLAGLHRIGATAVFVTLAYALGAALPMLFIAKGGRRIVGGVRTYALPVRLALGAVMAVGAVAIYEGWETSIQTKVPPFAASIQNWIEGNGVAKRELANLRGTHELTPVGKPEQVVVRRKSTLQDYGPAPDFAGISHWLNTPDGRSLSLAALRGKVVLVDFWTYSCINCLRTLPHLEAWDARYRSAGLEVVGVHTPEFQFEHDLSNVQAATKRLGVRYPVGLDNDYDTWNAFQNQYWPAEYLIDARGHIRSAHYGEGEYSKTENEIRSLLAERRSRLPRATQLADATPTGLVTPESYLGYARLQRYVGSELYHDRFASYTQPPRLPQSDLGYGGMWNVGAQRIVSGPGATIRLHFQARNVYIVLGGHGRVRTLVDGKPAGSFAVDGYRLYTAAHAEAIRDGVLELRFPPGIAAYSFTFG